MCGMTRSEDLDHAVHLGVDAVGFIFYSKSARYVTIEQAQELIQRVPALVDAVAVLVNPERDFVNKLLDQVPVQLLQFHGDESPDFCQQFKHPYIKAIHPKSSEHIAQSTVDYARARALLLDTPSDSARGGTGQVFDWRMIPKELPMPYILAGGLNEFNVKEALRMAKPYAIDVCSGIEAMPGVKDHLKMSRLMQVLGETNE